MKTIFLFLMMISPCLASAPSVFFTDLDAGPNTGGENNAGVYLTIYGNNFGSTQGSSTVTIGGGSVYSVVSWGTSYLWYQKIVVQIGSSAATGAVVVRVGGVNSNTNVTFTVRTGNIYYVSTSGSDSANGTSVSTPWATIAHARDNMAAGGTVYVRAGTYMSTDDGSGWATCMLISGNKGGSSSAGKDAIVAYPGETVNLGSTTACNYGIRDKGDGNPYWTFAGFHITGVNTAIQEWSSHDWRWIGIEMSCPNGNAQLGCLDISGAADGTEYNYKVYGNYVHDAGTSNPANMVTALYHGVYLSQQIHAIDFAWNEVAYVYGGRCIQENVNNNSSSDHASSYDMHIHHNKIHDCQCDGIVMTTVNPSAGTVELYENLIYNAGKGPANSDNSGAWNCMNIQGYTYAGLTESGTVYVYNNTMYGCGTFTTPPYSNVNNIFMWDDGSTSTKSVDLKNNIMYTTTGPTNSDPLGYMYAKKNGGTCSSACSQVTGSNNLFYNNGASPTNNVFTASVNSDPKFVTAGSDWHIQATSPANAGGVTTAATQDFDGLSLPQGLAYSIGAYDYAASGGGGGGSSTAAGAAFGGGATLAGGAHIQ